MKKALLILVVVAMVAVSAMAMVACNKADKVKVIEIKLTEEEYAFGVDKGDTELLNAVNNAIDTLKSNGKMDEIMNKYFAGEEVTGVTSATKDPSKDQLVVATNAAFAPFEYKLGNKFAGIDMEIAYEIATLLGKELVIDDMDFEAVVTSVGNGTCDIAMAGLTVNETRKESVDFTQKYYDASQMIIVKADDTTFDNCKTAADVEAVLKAMSGKKVGFQNGTTGEFYIKGDEDWGFDGYSNITPAGYANAGLAVQDMINGNIDFVVIDEMPAKTIAKSMNK
ncbi:MAG: transporter substrate-binding domain-containing protein [Clostridia bacterium]|nr:transporter substrate-binding domain-containing protein [Clostridia bacterium]MDY4083177.1 transporter substrate-binding domain-containing protein [Eubacteriales bacterium]